MDKAERALRLVESLAMLTTPEEEFEERKGDDGFVNDDGVTYEDVDEMRADMTDDQLWDGFHTLMDFVRAAKKICSSEEGKEDAAS